MRRSFTTLKTLFCRLSSKSKGHKATNFDASSSHCVQTAKVIRTRKVQSGLVGGAS